MMANNNKPPVKDNAESRIDSYFCAPGKDPGDIKDGSELEGILSIRKEEESAPDKPASLLVAKPFTLPDAADIPKRDALYGGRYYRKYLGLTVAPGGLGKSSLLMVEAVALASGKDLLDRGGMAGTRNVWLLNLEDPYEELQRRFVAICQFYGVTNEDLGGRLHVHSGRDLDVVVVKEAPGGTPIVTPRSSQMLAEIKEKGIDVIILDPFIATHTVNENDNNAIAFVAYEWGRIANDGCCAVELAHHVRKSGNGNGEAHIDDSRGAGALIDATRDARLLVKMTKEEAKKAGIKEDDRWRYSCEGTSKSNMRPPNKNQTWTEMVSVDLINGDQVGVQKAWKWPDPFDEVRPAHLQELLNRIAAASEPYTYTSQGGSALWIGLQLAEILDLPFSNASDKTASRVKLKFILETWVEKEQLEVFEVPHPKGNRDSEGTIKTVSKVRRGPQSRLPNATT